MRERRRTLLALIIALYLAVGYPGWNTAPVDGWHALLHVKRLYALTLLTAVAVYLIKRNNREHEQRWWLAGGAVALMLSIAAGLEHQRGLFDDYAYRLPMGQQTLLATQPIPRESEINAIALLPEGYRRETIDGSVRMHAAGGSQDALSLTASGEQLWTETVGLHSILEPSPGSNASISDAESPASLAGGKKLAFLRQANGRKQLLVRDLEHPGSPDQPLTTATFTWNVEEIAISPDETITVSATRNKGESQLYRVRGVDQLELISSREARYPATSPDGRWLAFSSFRSGYWNLFLRELTTGAVRRLTTVGCNQTASAWLPDSKTLLYSSDCGRALGFTAICKRRVLP
jgi:hypothetical protein